MVARACWHPPGTPDPSRSAWWRVCPATSYSLGFLDETEKQVAEHLDRHLERLPETDETASRRFVEQMREDELRHSHRKARELGGKPLPAPVKEPMRAVSKVMTGLSFRV